MRSTYSSRMGKALLLIAAVGIITPVYALLHTGAIPVVVRPNLPPPIVITDIKPSVHPILPPLPPQPTTPAQTTSKFLPPVIKNDDDVTADQLPPRQDHIVASGPTNEIGDPTGIGPEIKGPKGDLGVVTIPEPPKIFSWVEQMPAPAFNLGAFLSANLHYPDAARESNIEGRVMVKFVVNEDGHISDVQLDRGIGGGCDQEALRVIAAMPHWKPGKQNGKPVKVYFTQPIVFKLD